MEGVGNTEKEVEMPPVVPTVSPERRPTTKIVMERRVATQHIRSTITEALFKHAHETCLTSPIEDIPSKFRNFVESKAVSSETGQPYRLPKDVVVKKYGVPISHHCLYESECRWCYSCSCCGRPMCVDVDQSYEGSPCSPLNHVRRSHENLLLSDSDHIWMYLVKNKDDIESWMDTYENYRSSHCLIPFYARRVLEYGIPLWSKSDFLATLLSYHKDFGLDENFLKEIVTKV